jgi:hypothetical protein
MRRLLVAVAVGIGLLAMHGLAAPSAQAAHCGAPPGHAHAALDHASGDPASNDRAAPESPVQATLVPLPGAGDGSSGWLACVAILVGLALVAVSRRVVVGLGASGAASADLRGQRVSGRAPPAVRPEDVGVWRT